MKIFKKTLSVILNTIGVIFIVFAAVICVSVFTSEDKANPCAFNHYLFNVYSESMTGTFNKGDLIISRKYDGKEELKEGEVISFYTTIQNQKVVNSHRIVEVIDNSGMVYYRTKGDNAVTNPVADATLVKQSDVIAVWTEGRLPGVGNVMKFINSKLGFFLVLVLPVLLYTIYQFYKYFKNMISNNKMVLNEELQAKEDALKLREEEIKKQALEEYLNAQKQHQKIVEAEATEINKDNNQNK